MSGGLATRPVLVSESVLEDPNMEPKPRTLMDRLLALPPLPPPPARLTQPTTPVGTGEVQPIAGQSSPVPIQVPAAPVEPVDASNQSTPVQLGKDLKVGNLKKVLEELRERSV